MGSRQALSNGNEAEEITALLRVFEETNHVGIHIQLSMVDHRGKRVMLATAAATNLHADDAVRARWDLVSVVLWAREYKSLWGLVTTLLYRLDHAIGEREMQSIGVKKA